MPHKGKGRAYVSTPEHPKPKRKSLVGEIKAGLASGDEKMMKRMPASFRKMHESRKKKG